MDINVATVHVNRGASGAHHNVISRDLLPCADTIVYLGQGMLNLVRNYSNVRLADCLRYDARDVIDV